MARVASHKVSLSDGMPYSVELIYLLTVIVFSELVKYNYSTVLLYIYQTVVMPFSPSPNVN